MTRKKINIRVGIILSILSLLFIITAAIVCSLTDNIIATCILWTLGLLQPGILIVFIAIDKARDISIDKFYSKRDLD